MKRYVLSPRISLIALGFGLTLLAQGPRAVVAQDLGPVAVEKVTPVPSKFAEPKSGGGLPDVVTAGPPAVEVPRLSPVDSSTFAAMKAGAATTPAAQGADVIRAGPTPLAPTVPISFPGLNRQTAANNGFVFFPPDTIVSKSPNRVLEATNSAVRLFTNVGGVIQTKDLNTFFGAPIGDGLVFDPKTYYDRNAANRRHYVTALQASGRGDSNIGNNISRIWLAISRSTDPTNLNAANWCRYAINGQLNAGTTNASFADYPGLGAGADALLISANQFRFSNDSFSVASVRAFRKLVAANNAASCPTIPLFVFQAPSNAFTLQPVQHYTSPSSFAGTTNPAYLVSTRFGASNIYSVWQVRNVGTNSPTLRSTNVAGSFTFSVPPDATQPGTSVLLDTGDNRVTQAAGLGNALWGDHATGCNFGSGPNESCIRVVRIIAGQAPNGALTATLSQQQTFGLGNGAFIYWPGIAVNASEQTGVDFHYSSATKNTFLSSVWMVKNLAGSFNQTFFLTRGTCPQTLSNRTGDYIGTQTDPSDFSSFWFAGERAANIGGTCQWQTRVIKVNP